MIRGFIRSLIGGGLLAFAAAIAHSGENEIGAARDTITRQLEAFIAKDGPLAYSFAAPNITQLFPSVEAFMSMVARGYKPVEMPQSYAFGRSQETDTGSIIQEVLLVGPDGKNYSAIYTLELQPDGVFRITGVSLRESRAIGA